LQKPIEPLTANDQVVRRSRIRSPAPYFWFPFYSFRLDPCPDLPFLFVGSPLTKHVAAVYEACSPQFNKMSAIRRKSRRSFVSHSTRRLLRTLLRSAPNLLDNTGFGYRNAAAGASGSKVAPRQRHRRTVERLATAAGSIAYLGRLLSASVVIRAGRGEQSPNGSQVGLATPDLHRCCS